MGAKLINDDCRNVLDVLDEYRAPVVVVTDPPFNIGYKYRSYCDRLSADEYVRLLNDAIGARPFVLIHYPEQLYNYAIAIRQAPDRVISWVYNSNTARQHRDVAYFGIVPDFRKFGQPYKNPQDKRIAERIAQGKQARLYDWWQVNQVKNTSSEKCQHPCQMPVQVMRNIIGTLPDGIVVFDPFMGTGTTGVACMELGVEFVGAEIDKDYFAICQTRIHDQHESEK